VADLTIPGLGAIAPALADKFEISDASGSDASGYATIQQALGLLASAIAANGDAVAISEVLGVYKRKKTSNQLLAGETLENVTDLVVPVLSGHYYQFRNDVWFQTTATGTGIQLAMSGPITSMKMATFFQNAAANTVSTTSLITSVTGTAAAQVLTAVPTANVTMLGIMLGSFIASGDGNLQIQAAFEAGTTGTTIRAGSTFRVEDFGT
jgi:hypothetical protein